MKPRSGSDPVHRIMVAAMAALTLAAGGGCGANVSIGAKTFPESGVLAQAAAEIGRRTDAGDDVDVRSLNGTKLCWSALLQGDIDVYPEYTGTIRQEIFSDREVADDELPELLEEFGVRMTRPLGFNNTYALGVTRETAEALKLETISDLANHPQLKYGFSNEFVNRADGWPGLKQAYRLAGDVRGMEHALCYEGIQTGDLDVVDVYSTDANIQRLKLKLLQDDLEYFPRYDALFLYRADLESRAPEFVSGLEKLGGQIREDRMTQWNGRVVFDKRTEAEVAAELLGDVFGWSVKTERSSLAQRVTERTLEHSWLTLIALTAGILVAIPLGVIAAKKPVLGQAIVGFTEVVQTIPGLALLVFLTVPFRLLSLPVIGDWPVIAALFLYSLLPVVRNTMTGLTGLPVPLRESAEALGLSPWARLIRIELPIASPLILAGVKTTAVLIVGFAALGGLIGAGGYGQPIMSGLTLNDEAKMMEGAVPAALMALVVKWGFEFAERFVVPQGLRLKR